MDEIELAFRTATAASTIAQEEEEDRIEHIISRYSSVHSQTDISPIESAPDLPVTIFSQYELYLITAVSASATFLSSVSVPIYLPAFPLLEKDFSVTTEKMNLTVTVYSIFQGISPMIWGTLSDSIGRRPIYISCLSIYIGACVGLALSPSYWTLFGMRMLQAFGGASTVAIMTGVLGDITSRKTRGSYVGVASGIGLMGNCFGPLIGGGITSGLGWRAIFWFLIITASVLLLSIVLFLPETNRFLVSDGSFYPKRIYNQSPYAFFRNKLTGLPLRKGDDGYDEVKPAQKHALNVLGPFRILLEWDIILILIPPSIHYTTWFMVLTAESTLLSTEYGFSSLQIGLAYLANGAGSLVGSLVSGRIMTRVYKSSVKAFKTKCIEDGVEIDMREFNIQKARLQPSFYQSFALAASCIIFGWTIQFHVHFIVPILSTFLISFSSVFFINSSSTLLVDLFPNDAASATAVVNLTRCLLCAVGLAVVDKMIVALGAGGAFTLMAGICIASMSLIVLELRIGQNIEKMRRKRNGEDVRL